MKDNQLLIEYCLKKNEAYEDYPFGDDVLCIRLKGKIFAQFFYLKGQPKVTLKCEPDFGDFMKTQYPGAVTRGWHCPPNMQPYFITVALDSFIPHAEIMPIIDHAYIAVLKKLPRKLRDELS